MIAVSASASIEVYEFKTDEAERRFQLLIAELRCPKCQNQNLADSNAEIAKDLKARVYKLINQGNTDAEIVDYLIERYGDFVTYRPPVKPSTWLLWFGPFVLFFLVGLFLLWRTNRVNKSASASPDLDREKLQKVLSRYSDQKNTPENKPESK
jgi:cytochrome c-type biogenesis protein CcmH